jgi:hypothetical protein
MAVGFEENDLRCQAGIGIAMPTLIVNTMSVTIRQSDSEPIASAAATASFNRVEATRVERLSKPAARGDRFMVRFLCGAAELAALSADSQVPLATLRRARQRSWQNHG